MPARMVVVHDEPEFADPLAAMLGSDQDVAVFADPMAALDALDTAQTIEVLVTRVRFASGQPHGIALARMARIKRPGIRVLFVARPEFAVDAAGLGTFMARPVSVADVAEAEGRLLHSDDALPAPLSHVSGGSTVSLTDSTPHPPRNAPSRLSGRRLVVELDRELVKVAGGPLRAVSDR
jgi:hypothetical protein